MQSNNSAKRLSDDGDQNQEVSVSNSCQRTVARKIATLSNQVYMRMMMWRSGP